MESIKLFYVIGKPGNRHWINYKEAMIQAQEMEFPTLEYKQFRQIIGEIKHSVMANLQKHKHYDKLYFGENNYETMLKYQQKKKILLALAENKKKLSNLSPRNHFNIIHQQQKSSLSTNSSSEKILQDSTLKRKF